MIDFCLYALIAVSVQSFNFHPAAFLPRRVLRDRMIHHGKDAAIVLPEEDYKISPNEAQMKEQKDREMVYESVVRSGSTTVGPSSRPITIFPGDFVVHVDFGVAQFIKVDIVEDDEILTLHFADGVEYQIRSNEISKVSRMKAADAAQPPKLTPFTEKGKQHWKERVDSVRLSTRSIAQDILSLYG